MPESQEIKQDNGISRANMLKISVQPLQTSLTNNFMRPLSAKSQNSNSSNQKFNGIIQIDRPKKIDLDSHEKTLSVPVQNGVTEVNALNMNGNKLTISTSLVNNFFIKSGSGPTTPIRISTSYSLIFNLKSIATRNTIAKPMNDSGDQNQRNLVALRDKVTIASELVIQHKKTSSIVNGMKMFICIFNDI